MRFNRFSHSAIHLNLGRLKTALSYTLSFGLPLLVFYYPIRDSFSFQLIEIHYQSFLNQSGHKVFRCKYQPSDGTFIATPLLIKSTSTTNERARVFYFNQRKIFFIQSSANCPASMAGGLQLLSSSLTKIAK